MLGKRCAKRVENFGGRRPVLQLHQRRGRVVLGGRPNRRRRRAFRDAQEVARRGAIVLRLVRLLGLLVDRRREVVDERLPPFVLGRRQRQHLGVRGLGRLIVAELERRMRDDRPRRAAQRGLGRRVALDQRAPRGRGRRVILERIEILGRSAEHDRRMLVLGERVGELERALDRRALQLRLQRRARALELLAMREDRGVAGGRRALVRRIGVRRALVLARGLAEVGVLEQQVRELVVDARRLLVLRERREKRAIPDERLGVIRRLLLLEGVVLIERVIVIREILEVRLQVREHLGPLGRVEVLPVLALQAVLASRTTSSTRRRASGNRRLRRCR